MRIAYGMLRPDAGTVAIAGIERRLRSPADAIAAGIGMVHQHYALVEAMTVADNVALGLDGPYRARDAIERVRRLSAESGLALDPGAVVGDLSVEVQQRVEIVKALARDARTLILDEPTAVLAPEGATQLLRWLRRFADSGRAAILITHKLREALAVADQVTVLRRGQTVMTVRAGDTSEGELAAAMLGSTSVAGESTAAERGRAEQGAPRQSEAVPIADLVTLAESTAGQGRVEQRGPRQRDVVVIADHVTLAESAAGQGRVRAEGTPATRCGRDRRPCDAGGIHGRAGQGGAEGTLATRCGRDRRPCDARRRPGVTQIEDASLTVHAGEILGVAAIEGEGQRELLRALAGRYPVVSGGSSCLPMSASCRKTGSVTRSSSTSRSTRTWRSAGPESSTGRCGGDGCKRGHGSCSRPSMCEPAGSARRPQHFPAATNRSWCWLGSSMATRERSSWRTRRGGSTSRRWQRCTLGSARRATGARRSCSTRATSMGGVALADRIIVIAQRHVREVALDRKRWGERCWDNDKMVSGKW